VCVCVLVVGGCMWMCVVVCVCVRAWMGVFVCLFVFFFAGIRYGAAIACRFSSC